MSQAMTPKALHDSLLANKPEGAAHDEATCRFCSSGVVIPTNASAKEDAVSTFTKEELDAAVASAVAEASTRVSELEDQVKAFAESQHEGAIEAAVAKAKAEAQTEIDELKTKLDAATTEAITNKDAFDKFKSDLEAIETERQEAEALEAKRTERIARVADVVKFPDEHVAANADRWARLSDEEFDGLLEDWRQIAAKASDGVPTITALHAARDNDHTSSPTSTAFALMRSGVDVRNI